MTEPVTINEDQATVMELSEYMLETLRQDGEFILYRGQHQRQTDASPPSILVMTPVSERPALGSLKRMEHEYSLRAELDPGWAVRPLALAPHKGRTMLVLDDPGGEPLDRLLGQPMELTQFLRLAIGLSAALGQLHERGLIHKDIKPANILVNRATGEVWLTGFGIASRLPRERQAPEPPEVIAGHARLHGARTDRTDEPLDRLPQRPLRARRHALPDAHGLTAVHRVRSDGVGPLPYRQKAGAAQRAAGERPGPGLGTSS